MASALLERTEVYSAEVEMAKPSYLSNMGIGKFFNALISKAEEHITEAYSQRLKDHALDYNWPVDLVKGLKVVYNNGDHKIAYPQDLEEEILTLEYGTPSIPPSPALRTFSLGIEG
jgi:hypothetical protein